MVSAALVDSSGRLIAAQDPQASANITFRVVSGAGVLLGLHNGDPSDVPDGLGSTFPGTPSLPYILLPLCHCIELFGSTHREYKLALRHTRRPV